MSVIAISLEQFAELHDGIRGLALALVDAAGGCTVSTSVFIFD